MVGQAPPDPRQLGTPEDARKHLDYIQSVIARMASSCAVAKGWSLTIAVASYGYAGTHRSIPVTVLGLGSVLVFAWLDSRYLMEERRYRQLFRAAVSGEIAIYDMNASAYIAQLTKVQRSTLTWRSVVWSWSVRNYYGVLFLAGLPLLGWIIWG